VATSDINGQEQGRMAKGSMWEKEGLVNDQDARGKSSENPIFYIVK
jgi:hypothetical protein